jgi:hypothetical protein
VVRSYRLVFRRRWRIHRVQNWRVPVPQGIELRALAYWLAALALILVLARLPLLGLAVRALPVSLRLVAAPLIAAVALSRWELDGRAPHRAAVGLLGYLLRPRSLAGLRRCPSEGACWAPIDSISLGPELNGPRYPRGRVSGPARLLFRYPVDAVVEPRPLRRRGLAGARRLRLRALPGVAPLREGVVLEVPSGRLVLFEGGPADRSTG